MGNKSTPKKAKGNKLQASSEKRKAAVAKAQARDAACNADRVGRPTIGELAKKMEERVLGKRHTTPPPEPEMTEADRKAAAELDARDRAEDLAAKAALVPAASEPATASEPKAPSEPRRPRAPGQLSGLDAAHKVLVEAGQPLNVVHLTDRMIGQGLWSTTGKTPAATIYAAIIREIAAKGDAARFKKADRGMFVAP